MSNREIEKRLTALERQVKELANQLDHPGDINGWIDQIYGTFPHNAIYRWAPHGWGVSGESQCPVKTRARKNSSN